jgi:hypothetical protein
MQTTRISIAGEEILVEVVPVRGGGDFGLEETDARGGRGADLVKAIDEPLDQALRAIKGIVARTIENARSFNEATRPDEISIELGLSFTMSGSLVIASSEAGATLLVKMHFTPGKGGGTP